MGVSSRYYCLPHIACTQLKYLNRAKDSRVVLFVFRVFTFSIIRGHLDPSMLNIHPFEAWRSKINPGGCICREV